MVKKALWSTVLGAAFVVAHRGKSGKISSFLQGNEWWLRCTIPHSIFWLSFGGVFHRESTCRLASESCATVVCVFLVALSAAVIGSMRDRCPKGSGVQWGDFHSKAWWNSEPRLVPPHPSDHPDSWGPAMTCTFFFFKCVVLQKFAIQWRYLQKLSQWVQGQITG